MSNRGASRSPRLFMAVAMLALVAAAACEERPSPRSASDPVPSAGVTRPAPLEILDGDRRARAAVAEELRLAAVSPAIAITLRDLGLESSIVGRHAFDMVLDPRLPSCGDQTGIDYEALLAARPTHVLIEWGQRDPPPRLLELGASRGWDVRSYELLTLDQVESMAQELYRVFRSDRGDPRPWGATDLAMSMHEAWSRRETDLATIGGVLLLAGVEPPGALGPGSFHVQMLERLGGVPAIRDGGAWQVRDAEEILRIAPGAIIVFRPAARGMARSAWPVDEAIAGLGTLGTLDIPAVRRRRVAVIDDPLALTPSTAMVGVARELGDVLERWAREDTP